MPSGATMTAFPPVPVVKAPLSLVPIARLPLPMLVESAPPSAYTTPPVMVTVPL